MKKKCKGVMATVHAWWETERFRQQQQSEAKQGVPNRTETEPGGIPLEAPGALENSNSFRGFAKPLWVHKCFKAPRAVQSPGA